MGQRSDPTERLMPNVPDAARWLGLGGLIPFFGLALGTWVLGEGWSAMAGAALASYGAIILSFMGGCRWGFAAAGMGEGPALVPLAFSILPALYAWAAGFAAAPDVFFYLAGGFALLLGSDLALTSAGGAPGWWPALRWPLTAGAVASLAIAGFA